MKFPKKYHSVSIWFFAGEGPHYTIRGYYRGSSYLIDKTTNLDAAAVIAFATPRKNMSVALVPAKEELDAFADKIVSMMGATND